VKYDYGVSDGTNTVMFNSKSEALEWTRENMTKAKATLALVRRVRKQDEIIVENLKEFFAKKIPTTRPIISPHILEVRAKEKAEAIKEAKDCTVKAKVKNTVTSINKKEKANRKAFVDDTVKVTKIAIAK
jgi:hypothetical protein